MVILDHALDGGDGLSACFRIKQLPDPPGRGALFGLRRQCVRRPRRSRAGRCHRLQERAGRRAARRPSAPSPPASRACRRWIATPWQRPRPAWRSRISRWRDALRPDQRRRDSRSRSTCSPDDVRLRALRIIGELQARDRFGTPARWSAKPSPRWGSPPCPSISHPLRTANARMSPGSPSSAARVRQSARRSRACAHVLLRAAQFEVTAGGDRPVPRAEELEELASAGRGRRARSRRSPVSATSRDAAASRPGPPSSRSSKLACACDASPGRTGSSSTRRAAETAFARSATNGPTPEHRELVAAIRDCIANDLTPQQRQVLVTLGDQRRADRRVGRALDDHARRVLPGRYTTAGGESARDWHSAALSSTRSPRTARRRQLAALGWRPGSRRRCARCSRCHSGGTCPRM